MALFFRLVLAGLLLLLTVLPASAETLYNQPPFSEKELNQFIADLPRFRAWIKTNKEKAHPIVNEAGEPDFLYSKNAAGYIEAAGWKPERFFCIMGLLRHIRLKVEFECPMRKNKRVQFPMPKHNYLK